MSKLNIKNMNKKIQSITSDNGTENYDLVKLIFSNPFSDINWSVT